MRRAAAIYALIATAKLNNVDRQAWLADVLARINDDNIHKLDPALDLEDGACQIGGMSPSRTNAAFDSINEIATVFIERATAIR